MDKGKIVFFTFEPVSKEKKRSRHKNVATSRRVNALSSFVGRAVQLDLYRGLKRFKKKISLENLEQAWRSGEYSNLLRNVPWIRMPEELEPGFRRLQRAAVDAGKLSVQSLPPPVTSGLRYDLRNPRIERLLFQRTGELITNIQSDALKTVQAAVASSFEQALSPRQVAALIKDSVGLDRRSATALRTYSRGLQDKGYPLENIEKYSAEYADRLLNQRAMRIARSETRNATNYGQLYVWQEASEKGLIDRSSRKVWIVDGAPCPVCEPMDGKAVGLAEGWQLNNGDYVEVPNESHPNCLCTMELDMTGDETPRSYEYEET